MKKIFLLFTGFSILALGCGEVGFESNISQLFETDPVSVQIEVPALAVGQTIPITPETSVLTGEIDIAAAEFDDYVGDVITFTINEIYYEMNGFDSENEADLDIDLRIVFGGGTPQQLLSTSITNIQDNLGKDFLLYDPL